MRCKDNYSHVLKAIAVSQEPIRVLAIQFSRNGYGYEIINFYVHENDIEKVKEIKQEIIIIQRW